MLSCILVSLACGVMTGCEKVNATRARRIANKAVQAIRAEQYPKARSYLKQALALNPKDTKIRYLLGRVYEFSSDAMKAEQEYKRVLHLDPKNAKTHFQLGGIYLQWKKYPSASKHYEAAVNAKSDYIKAVYQLGLAYSKQKRFDAAAAQFNKSISKIKPYLGKTGKTNKEKSRIGELKSLIVEAYNNLAYAYHDKAEKARLELGDDQAAPYYSQAVAAIDRAKSDGVANEQTYNILGLVYQKQKKFQEAINAFDQAAKIKPYFSIASYNKGATYDMWLEEMMKNAKEEKDRSKIKEHLAKAATYRDGAIQAFKKFLQQHQGNQAMRGNVREKIMKLKLMREKEMQKRIKRERRELRRKRWRNRRRRR